MTKIPELPQELWAVRDAAIEYALTDAPLPANFDLLTEWLEGDGWDALLAAWEDDGELYAIKLKEKSLDRFCDSELRYDLDLVQGDVVTDAMRVQFAREQIDALEEDTTESPSVVSYKVTRQDGKSAVIGCTIEVHGQGGPVLFGHGVFRTKELFFKHLSESGLVLSQDLASLDDPAILAFWQYEKKKTKKAKKTRK